MNNQVKTFTVIAVILSLVGYSFLFIQGQRLQSENEAKKAEISKSNSRIKALGVEIEKEEEELDSLRKEKAELIETRDAFIQVIADSKDEKTLEQGKEIVEKKRITTGKFFVVTNAKNKSYKDALEYERIGFEELTKKNLDAALEAFIKSENSYNSFHQVYEIANYLRAKKKQQARQDEAFWQEVYSKVYNDFDYKMSDDFKRRFRKEIEQHLF